MKQQVHGNVTGVRDTLIEALGQLYDYEVDEDTFLPRELMQVLARFTGVLNREIAVYITRDGEVVDVSIGTDRDVELRDYRLRRNTQRLSCVRCIHTHPNGDGRLSDVDLSALRSFRYDAMVAIGCLKGEPTFVQSAFLVEKQNLLMDEPVRWYKTPDNDWMRQITESDRIVGWEADEKGTHVKERAVLMVGMVAADLRAAGRRKAIDRLHSKFLRRPPSRAGRFSHYSTFPRRRQEERCSRSELRPPHQSA